jgi:predicted ATPase
VSHPADAPGEARPQDPRPFADTAEARLAAPQRVLHYEVLALLGAGGMGAMWKARDTRLERLVALKRVVPGASSGPDAAARLLLEARAAAALSHPNVVRVHAVEDVPDGLVIVMEYVEGESLDARLRRGPLPLAELVRLGRDVAGALECAHAAGLVHRDIKPGNIMLTAAGAKVLDFGIAKHRGASARAALHATDAGHVVGTVPYMSPEQVLAGDVDGRSDIFALGAVLYEAATGVRPFPGEDFLAVAHQVASVEPASPRRLRPDLPAALEAVILRALRKARDERFHGGAAMAAALAAADLSAPAGPTASSTGPSGTHDGGAVRRARLPRPLTPFIGRAPERAALEEALVHHRLVTATGPGGVGKTRLAIAAAGDAQGRFADGAVFVGLVQVTDPHAVVSAVADAAGVPDRAGLTRREALLASLASRDTLLVMDNCEHVADAARDLVASILEACPDVRILATSRLRLQVPGEQVVAVPGLSRGDAPGRRGDAEELFVARARAAGATDAMLADGALVEDLCRAFEGMALAIELGASRVPLLGLDGLRRSLASGLELSARHHGVDTRHRSLRATIDWSYRLLAPDEQRLLRTCAVFAAPFTADAAATLSEMSVLPALDTLGRLVDWSLVTLVPGAPTRYRILETVRQFAHEQASSPQELEAVHDRHSAWCAATLDALLDADARESSWRERVDSVIDDGRAALAWAAAQPARRAPAAAMAERIARVALLRGHPSETQHRYEQAAGLLDDATERRRLLVYASRAALARYVGSEALRLLGDAAAVAEAAGLRALAGLDLAASVILAERFGGTMAHPLPREHKEALLARAAALGEGSSHVAAGITVAMAMAELGAGSTVGEIQVAVELAVASGDLQLAEAARDALCGLQLATGDAPSAMRTVEARLEAMSRAPIDAMTAMDHIDVRVMGVYVGLAMGHLRTARRHADALVGMPFLREEPHVALARLLEVLAFAGYFDEALAVAPRFEASWRRAGRPRISSHAPAVCAVGMVHGILGNDAERRRWSELRRELLVNPNAVPPHPRIWPELLDALVLLHRGDAAAALRVCAMAPDDPSFSHNGLQPLWTAWYAAAWAEASGGVGVADLAARIQVARHVARDNDVALCVIDRTEALAAKDFAALPRMAARLDELGCLYQAERTRRLATTPGPARR